MLDASIANNVHQQSTSTGTGNLSLTTVTGRQTFNAAFGTGGTDVFYYFARNRSANEWEVGTGHLSDSSTLVRDTVLKSSNSDSAVSFGSGTKDITNDVPAAFLEFVASAPIVRLVADSNLDTSTDLAAQSGQSVDGVTLAEGDLVLLTGQTDASENGIYVSPASGAASRHPAFATFDSHAGILVSVMEGSTYANSLWQCEANEGGTLGSSDIPFQHKDDAANVVFDNTSASLLNSPGNVQDAVDELAGGGTVIARASASDDAAVVFTGLDTYRTVVIHFDQVVPVGTGGVEFQWEVSDDNGSSWKTDSNYERSGFIYQHNGNTGAQGSPDSAIRTSINQGSGATDHATGRLVLHTADGNNRLRYEYFYTARNTSDQIRGWIGLGYYDGASGMNAIRALFESGNISQGEFLAIGYK